MNEPKQWAPLAAAIGSALALGSVQAATITVDTLDDSLSDDSCSLRAALASINAQEALYGCSAPDGIDDEIVFGDLTGTIELNGEQLEILEPAVISGPGAELLEISGQEESRVLLVQADSTISGVTISNGNPGTEDEDFSGAGGGIYLNEEYATLALEDCRIRDNVATYGGGLAVSAGQAIISRCEISSNQATQMGGGAWVDASLNERSGAYNSRQYGYQAYARLDMIESLVSGNEAWVGAGLGAGRLINGFRLSVPPYLYQELPLEPVVSLSQPNLSVVASEVSNNISLNVSLSRDGAAGGIAARCAAPIRLHPYFTLLRNRVEILQGSTVADNQAEAAAAGIWSFLSDLTIEDSLVVRNSLVTEGHVQGGAGGVSFAGLYRNPSPNGELVFDPQLFIRASEITDNSAVQPPSPFEPYIQNVGGLYVSGGTHTLEDLLISGNSGWNAGGIRLSRNTGGTLTRSTVTHNSGDTGGILTELWSKSQISLSEISHNQGVFVGGLGCNCGSDCELTYNSIGGNTGEVGGIGSTPETTSCLPFNPEPDLSFDQTVFIESSTISGNTGTRVGGIDADALTLRFATVANNARLGELPTAQGEDPPDPLRPPAAGVLTDGSTSVFDHSIVADNVSEMSHPDVVVLEQPLPVSFSVLGSVDPSTLAASDSFLQVSAQLEPLEANGSEWNLSHLPYPGSPAINSGDPNIQNAPQYDQRGPGFDRILDGRINIGAVEGVAAGLPGEAVPVSVMGRAATGLLAGGMLLIAWLGLRRTPIDRRTAQ